MTKKQLTLCILRQNTQILLGMKKRGFGEGKWNGFGGKVEIGESIEEGAKREMREEAGIEVSNLTKVGILDFEFEGDPQLLEVHVFLTESFLGTPTESEEMKPKWFAINEIPFDQMWSDDIHWMPLLLSAKKFKGKFLFGKQNNILEQELVVVESVA